MKRLIVAIIFIPAFYLYVTRLPEGAFFGLLSLIALMGLYEFYRMFRLKVSLIVLSIILGALLLYGFYIFTYSPISQFINSPLELLSLSFILIAFFRLVTERDPAFAMRDIGIAITGLLYIIGLLSFQLRLRHLGPEWIIYLYGVIWLSDSSAYYGGTYFGKRKLYPEISPKKTIEGAIASVIGGIAGSYGIGSLLKPSMIALGISEKGLSGYDMLILGAGIGLLCVIGDLIESMFKRDAGVKDSSNLIPGHGGILDKIDSALVVGPFVYWYLNIW